MSWLLLATEPSKVVAYPCHYKIPILSSTGMCVRGCVDIPHACVRASHMDMTVLQ